MVRTSTRSGGVHQPSSVSLLVSRSIANVKKCFKAEHAKAKRAQVSAKRTEEEQKRQQRYVEKCAKLRRLVGRSKVGGAGERIIEFERSK